MPARCLFVCCLMLLGFGATAQNDTYILRNLDYGKKPAVAKPRPVNLPPIVPRNSKPAGTLWASGQEPLLKWVQQHLKYPLVALRLGTEGRLVMRLSIAPEGNVTQVAFARMRLVSGDSANVVTDTSNPGVAALAQESQRLLKYARFESGPVKTEEEVMLSFVIR